MNQEIERIDLEVESIEMLAKQLILEADINLGLLSELIQVINRRISELICVKNYIMGWDDLPNEIVELSLRRHEQVFIKSRTDGEWIGVQSIDLVEIGQVFTIDPNQEGKYKLLSRKVKDDNNFVIRAEKVEG